MIGYDSLDEIKNRLKTSYSGLGSGMLQPADCSLESFKAWQAYNRFRQGVPLDNCKGENEYLYCSSLW